MRLSLKSVKSCCSVLTKSKFKKLCRIKIHSSLHKCPMNKHPRSPQPPHLVQRPLDSFTPMELTTSSPPTSSNMLVQPSAQNKLAPLRMQGVEFMTEPSEQESRKKRPRLWSIEEFEETDEEEVIETLTEWDIDDLTPHHPLEQARQSYIAFLKEPSNAHFHPLVQSKLERLEYLMSHMSRQRSLLHDNVQ